MFRERHCSKKKSKDNEMIEVGDYFIKLYFASFVLLSSKSGFNSAIRSFCRSQAFPSRRARRANALSALEKFDLATTRIPPRTRLRDPCGRAQQGKIEDVKR